MNLMRLTNHVRYQIQQSSDIELNRLLTDMGLVGDLAREQAAARGWDMAHPTQVRAAFVVEMTPGEMDPDSGPALEDAGRGSISMAFESHLQQVIDGEGIYADDLVIQVIECDIS